MPPTVQAASTFSDETDLRARPFAPGLHAVAGCAAERWLGVEPRHLATFVAVADEGSFRGAAARLGYVQSAVSQQIAQLERAIEHRLIERGKGSQYLVLTPAGWALLPRARRVVHLVQAACADVAFLLEQRMLRVAVEPAAARLVGRLAAVLGAQVSIVEAVGGAHPDLLASGDVDLALGWFPDPGPGLCCQIVADDRWVVVLPRGQAGAGDQAVISVAGLRHATLVRDRSHPVPEHLGVRADRVIHCDRLAVAFDLVRAGRGWAVVPGVAVDPGDDGLAVLALNCPAPKRPVSLIWLAARQLPLQLTRLRCAPVVEATGTPAA